MPSRTSRDPVRLLGRTGGYTDSLSRALRSGAQIEPEAVPAGYQRTLADRAHRDAAAGREAERERNATQNGWARRIRIAKAEAARRGIDVHPQLRTLKLVMKAGRSDAAIENGIRALELRALPRLPAD